MYFSPSLLTFFPTKFADDAYEIDDATYFAVLHGQTTTKVIGADANGRPVLVDKPLDDAQILAANTATRGKLLAAAALAIAPLQDASDLQIATDAEIALLTQWKQYRVDVSRVDLTASAPDWPATPA